MPDDVTNIQTNLVVERGGVEVARTPLKDLSTSVAMTWSSDFRTFAVTWSDGGMIGEFHVKVLRLQGELFVELPAANRAFSHFKSRHDCPDRGDNIQAYRFEESGSRLMLILSVYPTSDCGKEMGYTEGYLIRAQDGAILRQYSLHELNAYMRQHPEGS